MPSSSRDDICIAAIPTVEMRLEACIPLVVALLQLPFVVQVHVRAQFSGRRESDRDNAAETLRRIGGAMDSRVLVTFGEDRWPPLNRDALLRSVPEDVRWCLMVDDDMALIQKGVQALWDAREGHEAICGTVYLSSVKRLTDDMRGYNRQADLLDRVHLFDAEVLRSRGGFLPNTAPLPAGRYTGEDILASDRLSVKYLPVLVGVEDTSPSFWDPNRGCDNDTSMVSKALHKE